MPVSTKQRVIGLLGGSFNPAHRGHLHISRHALNALGMDEVWWLVSPQNPLKASQGMAGYGQRLQSARAVAAEDRRIKVTDIEARLGTRYTVDTLEALTRRFPGVRFVWMMGADNLAQFHRWKRWERIMALMPVAVFDRAPYSHRALRSKAALRFKPFLLKSMDIRGNRKPPAWIFRHLRRDPLSSTFIRKKLGTAAFLRHNKDADGD